jgi:hypothetical protein
MSVKVEAEGLGEYERFFAAIPDRANQAASRALNDVAGGSGLAILRTDIQDEVAFPTGYVNQDRLYFSQRATPQRLEARITGRQRATSLARFALPGTVVGGKGGVQVQVHRGRIKLMKNAFLVNLRAGTDDGGNLGLAIRLKPGERLANTQGAVRLTRGNRPGDNVWLLYGPSVNQVLRDVATRDTPAILRNVSLEFLRQWQLLGKS